MKKRMIYPALILVLILALTTAVFAAGTTSSNINGHFYINAQRWYKPIVSNLTAEDGGFVRAECIGDQLVVEYYDGEFNHLSTKTISLELPLFGGVFMDDDYNFLVVGQNNEEEDDTKEVFRIIRYTKDWERVDHTGLYGANTIHPFDGGSLRFDRCGDYLYIRTCHEMYTADDGLNHQANVMIQLQVSTMTITDEFSDVLNKNYGYVSHSFNQFVRVDGTTLLAVDHGDAHPRSVVLIKYPEAADQSGFFGRVSYVEVLPIADSTKHYNDTGVSVGGFEVSSTHYLIAGSSADMSVSSTLYNNDVQRNIFVTATDKSNFTEEGTTVHYLTDYTQGDNVKVSPPHLVKLDHNRFFLTWTEDGVLHWCTLNGKGQLEGEIYSGSGALSDCVPVLDGDRLVWYVTDDSAPVFYSIELDALGDVSSPHDHTYDNACDPDCNICGEARTTSHSWDNGKVTQEPTCKDEGVKTYTCTVCGETRTESVEKTTTHTYDNACDPDCNICGEARTTSHSWDNGKVTQEPTCKDEGVKTYTCTVCGETRTESVEKTTTHTWDGGNTNADGSTTFTCTVCGETKVEAATPPTEPTVPTEPSAPTEPGAPTEPSAPTEPNAPTEPSAPTEPTQPTQPATQPSATAPAPTAPSVPSDPTDEPVEDGAIPIIIAGIVVSCAFLGVLVVLRKKNL